LALIQALTRKSLTGRAVSSSVCIDLSRAAFVIGPGLCDKSKILR
jgi:hypothetical protein